MTITSTIFSRNTSVWAVYAEPINRTFFGLREKPVFERGESNRIEKLSTKAKYYKKRIHSPAELTAS